MSRLYLIVRTYRIKTSNVCKILDDAYFIVRVKEPNKNFSLILVLCVRGGCIRREPAAHHLFLIPFIRLL